MVDGKTRVAIADDEPHIRALMRVVLEMAGYAVVAEAANGSEAVDMCLKETPDLLLMDINMPVMTGIEALKEIVSRFPSICVIMLSTISDTESIESVIDIGASHFIRKDTPITEMKEIITKTWNEFKASPA